MQTKNNVESTKNTLTKTELKQLAQKDKEVLEFDAMSDVLQTLKTIHEAEAPDVPFRAWLNSKDDDYFKRLKYAGGGKVIQFPVDLTKYREPKYKKINISAGFGKDKTVASLTDDERDVVERLLRMSLGKEVD
tara:strand:+ start:241 stop:639 length:399 start_codon:yes stop_codon:yes gene_type:complete